MNPGQPFFLWRNQIWATITCKWALITVAQHSLRVTFYRPHGPRSRLALGLFSSSPFFLFLHGFSRTISQVPTIDECLLSRLVIFFFFLQLSSTHYWWVLSMSMTNFFLLTEIYGPEVWLYFVFCSIDFFRQSLRRSLWWVFSTQIMNSQHEDAWQ